MSHLIGVAQLFNSSCGVAAADDGDSAALGHSLSDSVGARCEVRPLGNAHRSVPDNGSCADERLSEQLLGLFADVETHPAVRNGIGVDAHEGGVLIVFAADDVVDREQKIDFTLTSLFYHLVRKIELVVFADGSTNGLTLGLEEGVGHAAADD